MIIDIYDDENFSFEKDIERKRLEALNKVKKIKVAILLWGPSLCHNTEISNLRENLQIILREKGHLADFSEDLCEDKSDYSLLTQQAVQADAYDIVISIPDTPGSIAEIHDFSRIPHISHKIVVFLNSELDDGYSNKTLIELQSHTSCKVFSYDSTCFPNCIIDEVLRIVAKLQETYFLLGRRGY
jgi:hypothetical protein